MGLLNESGHFTISLALSSKMFCCNISVKHANAVDLKRTDYNHFNDLFIYSTMCDEIFEEMIWLNLLYGISLGKNIILFSG
jgi:hypothetical protein